MVDISISDNENNNKGQTSLAEPAHCNCIHQVAAQIQYRPLVKHSVPTWAFQHISHFTFRPSLSLRLSLSPKFRLRLKFSQKVKSSFHLDSAISWGRSYYWASTESKVNVNSSTDSVHSHVLIYGLRCHPLVRLHRTTHCLPTSTTFLTLTLSESF